MIRPFALPDHLSPDLTRVLAYWRGLLRGSAQIPFWDDAKLTDLPDLSEKLFLIDVFQQPERFRIAVAGHDVGGEGLCGRFLDEFNLPAPVDYLRAQCAATVEGGEPTYLQEGNGAARLLLPMWGEGHISMLLGAIDGPK